MTTSAAPVPTAGLPISIPTGVHVVRIVSVRHYTDRLFAFRATRPLSFRFRSGEFAMIGLPNAEKPLFRAYSIASPAWDDELEFFSVKIDGGPFTQHLQRVEEGDALLIRPKTTGTLVLDALRPGRRLWLLSTGTGIAPFAAIARDPATYEMFEQVVLAHSCRMVSELAFGFELAREIASDPAISEFVAGRFKHDAATTREPFRTTGRITERIWDGSLFSDLGTERFDPRHDRIMICGSIGMTHDLRAFAQSYGFKEGSISSPGEFVVERAFVG